MCILYLFQNSGIQLAIVDYIASDGFGDLRF